LRNKYQTEPVRSRVVRLTDIVDWRLCVGCGACAYICPKGQIALWDFLDEGIRPVVGDPASCGECRRCVDVCPGVETDFGVLPPGPALGDARFRQDWGQVLEIWEGHAVDSTIRFRGSSGGALTALAAYCLEQGGMHGVLHIGQNPDDPVRNSTRLSRTRNDLMKAVGSRYAPASVCNGLGLVEAAPAPCAIIGKPSEIAALRKAEAMQPGLAAKVGVAMSFFCAESPSTAGTLALLEKMGVQPAELADLRYRGEGWPGHFAPTRRGETAPTGKMTYAESWAFLQRFRPWSVQLWPDGSGELADISCGDPWYEQPDGENPGFSLVVVRTEKGREIVRGAIAAGYLALTPAEPWKLAKSQVNLSIKKASMWGRTVAMRAFGLPAPQFLRASLFSCWLRLTVREKLQSFLATARRILKRKLHRPLRLNSNMAVKIGPLIES